MCVRVCVLWRMGGTRLRRRGCGAAGLAVSGRRVRWWRRRAWRQLGEAIAGRSATSGRAAALDCRELEAAWTRAGGCVRRPWAQAWLRRPGGRSWISARPSFAGSPWLSAVPAGANRPAAPWRAAAQPSTRQGKHGLVAAASDGWHCRRRCKDAPLRPPLAAQRRARQHCSAVGAAAALGVVRPRRLAQRQRSCDAKRRMADAATSKCAHLPTTLQRPAPPMPPSPPQRSASCRTRLRSCTC
jgi:hypothetical protein